MDIEMLGPRGQTTARIAVRDIDLPVLCRPNLRLGKAHLARILAARQGDREAGARLATTLQRFARRFDDAAGPRREVPNRYVVPCDSAEEYPEARTSHKGFILLKLSQLGYSVPAFVILTSDAYEGWREHMEQRLADAVAQLESLTCARLGAARNPLVMAVRCAMPSYVPGVMPTYLNVGVTEKTLPALERSMSPEAAKKMYLNNLRNICLALDREAAVPLVKLISRHVSPEKTNRLIEQFSEIVVRKDRGLVEDGFHQAAFMLKQAYLYFEQNQDVLVTLSRGANHYPSMILQKMICTVRHDEACAGVLHSRHPQTGEGRQIETAYNIFGEEIMSGMTEAEQTSFGGGAGNGDGDGDGDAIKESFPAIHHFVPQLPELERMFESPVTIELAVEATRRHHFFALLQLNETGMSGRASFITAMDMHKSGVISRRRVTEVIRPYHVKQIESDTIDYATFDTLNRFCSGIAILPRSAVSARIYFTAEDALTAKKRGEKVCFCKRAFAPSDTVVMREMDAIISLTSAAIHVVTICQSFGAPALLRLEQDGVSLHLDGKLVNGSGRTINSGDWVTISSRRQVLYQGKAEFKPARLLRYMKGEPVQASNEERAALDTLAYAYRYYQQLVKGLKHEQISTLKEVIRLVNLELRGEAEEARRLVNGWIDSHEALYVQEVFSSDMGDHLNQSTIYEMLSLERKIRFLKQALAKCSREGISGYSAGAFMLGRFICAPSRVAFWRAFGPCETGLLVNEWVLFEKYIQMLHEVGERRIIRVRKKLLSEGLDQLFLHPGNVKGLIPLKLSGTDLDEVSRSLPAWSDPQTTNVLALLREPYGAFYDFDAPWSMAELEQICATEQVPVPREGDT